jgi:hypothetical protein
MPERWARAFDELFRAAAGGDPAAGPLLARLAVADGEPHVVPVERGVRPGPGAVRALRAMGWDGVFVPCQVTLAGLAPADAAAMAIVTGCLNRSGLDVVETHVAAGALVSLYAPGAVDLRRPLLEGGAAARAVYERCLDGLGRYVDAVDAGIQDAVARATGGALPRRFDLAGVLDATIAALPSAPVRAAALAARPAWAPVLGPLVASTTRRTLYYDAKPANFIELPDGGPPRKVDVDLMLETSTVVHQAVVAVFTYPIPRLAPTPRATHTALRCLAARWLDRYGVTAEELDLQLVFHLCRRVLAKAGRAPEQARTMAEHALLALERLGGAEARVLGALVERAAA